VSGAVMVELRCSLLPLLFLAGMPHSDALATSALQHQQSQLLPQRSSSTSRADVSMLSNGMSALAPVVSKGTGKMACHGLGCPRSVRILTSSRVLDAPRLAVATEPVLADFLATQSAGQAQPVLEALSTACQEIALKVRTASCDSMACFNNYGNEQLAVDVLAEAALMEGLRNCGVPLRVSTASDQSEEVLGDGEPELAVTINALDGSSVIDSNFAIGTLFSVWREGTLLNNTGRDLLAAGACSYGPRTSLYLSHDGSDGVQEFLLVGGATNGEEGPGRWIQSNHYSSFTEGKLFAPGNLRVAARSSKYAKLIKFWQDNEYQLRYSGGMVMDVLQLIVKGRGIFVCPAAPAERPRPHLLYEAVPLAYLIEKSGGRASDGEHALLDVTIHSFDQRTQMALGSANEVERFESTVGPADSAFIY